MIRWSCGKWQQKLPLAGPCEIMADDLDELLDEVEAKFCRDVSLPGQCNLEEHAYKELQDRRKTAW